MREGPGRSPGIAVAPFLHGAARRAFAARAARRWSVWALAALATVAPASAQVLPPATLEMSGGGTFDLGGLRSTPLILLFTLPECALCRQVEAAVLPAAARLGLAAYLVTPHEEGAALERAPGTGPRKGVPLLLERNYELARALGVSRAPTLVLISNGRVVEVEVGKAALSGLESSLRALAADALQPRSQFRVAPGERFPAMNLPRPDGRLFALPPPGRPALLVLWSDRCLACRMQEEALIHIATTHPRLLIVLIGTAPDDTGRSAAQRGTLVHDLDGGFRRLTGAPGTPSNFLLDETGTLLWAGVGFREDLATIISQFLGKGG